MKIDLQDTKLRGCKFGKFEAIEDPRGSFTKIFQSSEINKILPGFQIAESYITKSIPGVLRGMHFQNPPDDHEKIVICLEGHVLDVLLDLRSGESLGLYDSVNISKQSQNFAVIPKGVAHGFFAYEMSTLLYLVSTQHAPNSDLGIKWDSFGFVWPSEDPILSERDAHLLSFKQFVTPF